MNCLLCFCCRRRHCCCCSSCIVSRPSGDWSTKGNTTIDQQIPFSHTTKTQLLDVCKCIRAAAAVSSWLYDVGWPLRWPLLAQPKCNLRKVVVAKKQAKVCVSAALALCVQSLVDRWSPLFLSLSLSRSLFLLRRASWLAGWMDGWPIGEVG